MPEEVGRRDRTAVPGRVAHMSIKTLLMAACLVAAWILYFQGGLGFKLLAFVVILPGAVVGWREVWPVVRAYHQRPQQQERD